MRFILLIVSLLSSSLIGQDASSKIYWNSLATAVNIGVPLEDDKTLKGGRIQIRVSFDQGKTFDVLISKFDSLTAELKNHSCVPVFKKSVFRCSVERDVST